ncbi:MAG: DnaJ domain-containing protein [Bacilli bacterium]|nr:DnaJ domain-containing protein [Bacilli bacterium]
MNFDKAIQTLGIAPDHTVKELKKAYRKAAGETHPDVSGDEEKFKEVNEAYHFLKENSKRSSTYSYTQANTSSDEAGYFYGPGPVHNPKPFSFQSSFNGKVVVEEDFYENIAFVNGVFDDYRFQSYHKPATNQPNSFVHYETSTGEKRWICTFWKDSKGLAEQVIFKTFDLWQPHEKNVSLETKLEKEILFEERFRLDRYFTRHMPLDCWIFLKKYVAMYLTAIDTCEAKYASDDLTLYAEIAKIRQKICQKLAKDFKIAMCKNGTPYLYDEVCAIVDEGIATFLKFADNAMTAGDVANRVIDEVSEDWIDGCCSHTEEDFSRWQDTISLSTSFSVQLDLFYSNVLFKVYQFYCARVSALPNAYSKSYELDLLWNDMCWSKKIVITEEDLKGLEIDYMPKAEVAPEIPGDDTPQGVETGTNEKTQQRNRKFRWFRRDK